MGIAKILHERAIAIKKAYSAEEIEENISKHEIFVCIPFFIEPMVKHIPFVRVIPTFKLNPEPEKYYYNDDPVLSDE